MKIIEKKPEKIIFQEEINESLANAIRRSVNEIPILAIEELEITKNDSALYDEILAHRLGLVPLENQDLKSIKECDCKGKGCSKCSVSLKLSTKGPKTVYSKELKGKAVPVYEKMPITVLEKAQELEFSAVARIGKGVEHAKFSPGLVFYRNLAEIKVESDCDACLECVKACPQDVLHIENKKLKTKELWKCDLCEACVEACKKHGKKAIQVSPTKELVFFIESFGQIKAEEILKNSINALKSNLKELEKKIK